LIIIEQATPARMADNLMIYKYVVKNTARQKGMTKHVIPCSPRGPPSSSGSQANPSQC
jgi:glutamine synthetase